MRTKHNIGRKGQKLADVLVELQAKKDNLDKEKSLTGKDAVSSPEHNNTKHESEDTIGKTTSMENLFNKVTLQSTHWSIQTLPISGGDSSCSWVFYSCTGPKCGVGVDLVDCNAVGGGHVATSIDQSVRISACGALALEEYKQSASVQPLLCNS